MTLSQDSVRDFMRAVGQECPDKPTIPDPLIRALRLKLHYEEAVQELDDAFIERDLVKIADSIADSLVVILGTACACGIDITPIFDEIMKSNWSKVEGGYVREDGKWMKGVGYVPPNIEPLLDAQS